MSDNRVGITITADDQASPVFRAISAEANAFGAVIGKAAIGVGALASAAAGITIAGLKGAIADADNLNDLSQKLGMGVQQLAAYKLAAEQSGTSMEAIAQGVKSLSGQMLKHGDAFKKIGIDTQDADKAFRQLADVFSGMPDGMEKAALATKLFGRAGMELIPTLNLGSKGLDDAAQKAEKYAQTMAALAPQADKLNDTLAEFSLVGKAAFANLALEVVPSLTRITEAMADAAREGGVLQAVMVGVGGAIYESMGPNFRTGMDLAGGDALKALGLFGTMNPFRTVDEQVVHFRGEVDALSKSLEYLKSINIDGAIDLSEDIAKLDKAKLRLEYSRVEQSRDLLRKGGRDTEFGDYDNAVRQAADRAKGDAARKESEAKAAELRKIYESKQKGSNDAARLAEQEWNNRLKVIAAGIEQERQLIDLAHARGLSDEMGYQEAIYRNTVAGLGKRAAAFQAQLDTTTDPVKREKIVGDLAAVQDAAIKAGNAWQIAMAKAEVATQKALDAVLSDAWKNAVSIGIDNDKLREELDTLGMTTEQLTAYRAEKLRAAQESESTFADGVEAAARAIEGEGEEVERARQHYLDLAAAKRALAGNLGQQIDLVNAKGVKELAVDAAKESAKAWEKGWEDTDRLARQAFADWADGGKDMAERIGDSLKTALLSAIYEATLRPLVFQMYTAGTNALGMGGPGGAASGTGGVGNLANAASTGYQMYGMAGNIANLGFNGAMQASAFQTFGGMGAQQASMLAAQSAEFGLAGSAATLEAAGASSAMAGIGAALPWVGAGLAVASLLGGMFGDKESPPEAYINQFNKGTTNPWVSKYYAGEKEASPDWAMSPFGIMGIATQHMDGEAVERNREYTAKYLKPIAALDKLIAAQLDKSQVADIVGSFKATESWDLGGNPDNVNGALQKRLNVITDAIGGWVDTLGDTVKGDLQKKYTAIIGLLSSKELLDKYEDALLKPLSASVKTVDKKGKETIAYEYYKQFAKEGEVLADTVMRMVGALETVNQVFDDLGYTFKEISIAGADAASDLVDAFGGLEQFKASTAQYFNLFYSDAEKQAAALANIGEAFAELDLALPATKEGFRAMVEAIDLTTVAGTELYAALLGLAPAFAQAADMTAQVSFAGVESALAAVRKSISAEIDSIRAIADEKIKVIDGQIDSKQITLSANEDLLAESARLVESLSEGIDKLRNGARPEAQTIAAGRAAIDAMLVASQAGIMPDADELEKALSAVLQDQAKNYATAADFQRAQLQQAGKLDALNKVAKTQKDAAQELVDLAKTQLDTLEAQRTALEDAADAQIAALQDQATAAAAQLDALKGIDTGVKSLSAAMASHATAVASTVSAKAAADAAAVASVATAQVAAQAAALQAAKDTVSGFSYLKGRDLSDQTIQALASAVSNANTSVAQIGTTNQAALVAAIVEKTGAAVADISKIGGAAIVSLAKEVGVKNVSYDVGTSYVPSDMTANIHKGEIIVDPQSSAILRRYGIGMNVGGDPALAAEVAALRAELKAALGAVASNTRQSKDLLDSVVNGGNTLRTEVIA